MNKKVTLACSDCGSRNYSTTTNKQTSPERLELKKFCKSCGSQTVHRETK
ncbi:MULTISPECIES: 50S ribosomal protein L33 [unclassified Bacillus (in: firmicutes)]|nr:MULTISPECIES: 50S ribosomal protein L33 [unclassified Bacillus (in: firmicutes)]SFQ91596.1 LSU ribosomal protein L33P [Bacillus sp. cl95]